MSHYELANKSIENFTIDEDEYATDLLGIHKTGSGSVFMRKGDVDVRAKIKINFGKTSGCKVFIGRKLSGSLNITFLGDDSLVYIGNECRLNNVDIRSWQNKDFIAIGNHVTTASTNRWISGLGATDAKPAIIIGDDCMFSYDVVIRNSDGHPIFDLSSDKQINQPKGVVHIEPHVWIGQQVSILKSVTIGACSIISLGAIVTKDIPRFSIASGVPATARFKPDIYWARNYTDQAATKAKYFTNKFKNSKCDNIDND